MLSLMGVAAWNWHASAAEPAPQSLTPVETAAPEPAAAPVPDQSAVANAAATSSTAAAPATPSGAKLAPTNDARDKRLRAMGYRPELRHGETFYCRREAVVGSRFESTVCGSADDLEHVTTDSQDTMNQMQQHQVYPTGK
jgi:hypothetical protein